MSTAVVRLSARSTGTGNLLGRSGYDSIVSLAGRRVLIIVQNLPVPLDRRVWLECRPVDSRRRIGECHLSEGPRRLVTPDDRWRPDLQVSTSAGSPWCGRLCDRVRLLGVRTALLSLVVRRDVGFDVIQACNPPDTYWLLGRMWQSRGVRFVFDQHDLNPELFLSRFGEPAGVASRLQFWMLRWLEKMTYRTADHVISTNESYRTVAMTRGGRGEAEVTVVRSGPDTEWMRPVYPPASIRDGCSHLLVYLGIMGPQDGVDGIVDVMDDLVHRRGRRNVRAVLLGFGDCLEDLRRKVTQLGLDDHVHFTGRVGFEQIADHLSAADVGLCPDLKSPLNDLSTMNKTMEYMSYCLPSVSFDLVETEVSAGDTAVYVPSGDLVLFADEIEKLLDDDDLRLELGLAAPRVADHLDWREQARKYVDAYCTLLDADVDETVSLVDSVAPDVVVSGARTFVPLDDDAELRRFVRERRSPRDAE